MEPSASIKLFLESESFSFDFILSLLLGLMLVFASLLGLISSLFPLAGVFLAALPWPDLLPDCFYFSFSQEGDLKCT